MTDETPGLDDRLVDLHAHLEATAQRPVETSASRWLGEAEAVAADTVALADEEGELDGAVVARRVEQIRDLLSNVDETGDEGANEQVAAARREAIAVLDRVDEPDPTRT